MLRTGSGSYWGNQVHGIILHGNKLSNSFYTVGHIQAALILSVTLHSVSVKNLNCTLLTSNIPCRVVQQLALPFYTPFVLISLPLVSMWLLFMKNEFNYIRSFHNYNSNTSADD